MIKFPLDLLLPLYASTKESNIAYGKGINSPDSPLITFSIEEELYGVTYHKLYSLNMITFELSESSYAYVVNDAELEYELRKDSPYRLDEDVLEGIAEFILLDLPPSSLCEDILNGKPLQHLRERCNAISKKYLPNTISYVDYYTNKLFHNVSLQDKEAVHNARCLIKSHNLHHFWIKHLGRYWVDRRITAYSFVPPFNASDVTHKYFAHPLKLYIRD